MNFFVQSYFSFKQELFRGYSFVVLRGIRNSDQKPIIVKNPVAEVSNQGDISRLKNEFYIHSQENLLHSIKAIDFIDDTFLILEDFGGVSLLEYLKKNSFTMSEFFSIAIAMTESLIEVHRKNIIHKDIKPANFIINENTKELKLTDFGISTLFQKEYIIAANNKLEGTVNYISPEQTGRTGKPIDYRTDLYSLGISFYEILTGRLPFAASDLNQILHFHLAQIPDSPQKYNSKIPAPLALVIQKLISKDPILRYQSAYGLKLDLLELQKLYEEDSEKINSISFVPGKRDVSEKFTIPEKLYGREKEIQVLRNSFLNTLSIKNTNKFLLVKGYSGIGKTSLISELCIPIEEKKGVFLSGKFEQYQRNIPFSGISQSFREFVRYLLSKEKSEIEKWRKDILATVGSNGKVVIDVIPELELILGTQSEVPEVAGEQAMNRFTYTFLQFVKVCARIDHPIVLFLDDLQWADSGSLFLLEQILKEPDLFYFLVIGAFRDNEISHSSGFQFFLNNLDKENISYNSIHLGNLGIDSIQDLLIDTFHSNSKELKELTNLIYSKTNGNPFFTRQLLQTLYEQNLIYFQDQKWSWQMEKINKLTVSENVVDLMLDKIRKLPLQMQSLLGFAACMGIQFKITMLIKIFLAENNIILQQLETCINEGLIIPIGDSYKIFSLGIGNREYYFEFLHDRIQQASYQLISDGDKKEIHLKIGRHILEHSNEEELNDRLFDILEQINHSLELLGDEEKYTVAILNLRAGKQAKASVAYISALQYFQNSLQLLSLNHWDKYYYELFECTLNIGETEFLLGNYSAANEYFEIGMTNAKTRLDKVKLFNLRIALFNSQGEYDKAIESGMAGLTLYDFKIPSKLNDLVLFKEYLKVKTLFGQDPIAYIQSLPQIEDIEKIENIKLFLNIMDSIYLTNLTLGAYMAINTMFAVINSGNSLVSSLAYINFAAFLCNIGEYKLGYTIGKYGIENVSDNLKAKSYHIFCSLINPWSRPVRDSFSLQLKGIQIGIETGDIIYACYNAFKYVWNHFFAGMKIETTLTEGKKYLKAVEKLKNKDSENFLSILISHLQFLSLTEMDFSESEIYEKCKASQTKMSVFLFYLLNLERFFISEDYSKALESINEILQIQESSASTMYFSEFRFYYCLTILATYKDSIENQKSMEKELKQWKVWADNSKQNHLHKYLLLQAEWSRIQGRILEAMEFYDQSILSAKESEFLQNSALASKLAGMFYKTIGREKIADLYFTDALHGFTNWGSLFYSNFIKSKYLKNYYEPAKIEIKRNKDTTASTTSSIYVDLNSILKASRIISGEVRLDALAKNLLQVIIENAGAERGILLIAESDEFLVYSEANVNGDYLFQKRKQDSNILPIAVTQYVALTKETIVLHNAQNERRFQQDRYITEKKIKSVVCLPILNQNQMLAILYLENNLFEKVFTEDRIETIHLLTSQAAVSIQNSILYQSMEDKVKERTNELKESLDKVNELKKQQDADYFLTSLLIQPLSNNQLQSKIKIEFLIHQKKEFEFKKQMNSIGGDICIADEITLKNKKMLVYINADAMGKSLQGAGGTLVLGSVFKSIIERTKMNLNLQNQYPEPWLKYAFTELHKIFQSFEGFMLVSAVMGVLEEDTGFMYYINAEHPLSVLYRDGKASFITKSQNLFKLGSLGGEESIAVIQTVETFPGDIIINGSDGREDLVSEYTENGKPIVSHEENLFLEYVEKAKGNLVEIEKQIQDSWDLYDDLSLLKIEIPEGIQGRLIQKISLLDLIPDYFSIEKEERRENLLDLFSRFEKENRKNIYVLKVLAKEFAKLEEYGLAARCSEMYCEANPSDIWMFRICAYNLKKNGEFEKANQWKERIRLRNLSILRSKG